MGEADRCVERGRGRLLICLVLVLVLMPVLALCGCGAPAAAEPSPGRSPANTITAITLERGCFGCPSGSILILRRDGTASYTLTGNARLGTEDNTSTGTVRADDFDVLARLAVSQGFFELDDSYEDPQVRDGAWATTSVDRAGRSKRVFSRDDAAPPRLRALQAAIEDVKARMKFAAER